MPKLIHLNTNSFIAVSILFMIAVLYSLKKDIDELKEHKKRNRLNEYKSKKSRVSKIYDTMCKGALRGAITGSIIGGGGGAVAGAFIIGISGGLITAVY